MTDFTNNSQPHKPSSEYFGHENRPPFNGVPYYQFLNTDVKKVLAKLRTQNESNEKLMDRLEKMAFREDPTKQPFEELFSAASKARRAAKPFFKLSAQQNPQPKEDTKKHFSSPQPKEDTKKHFSSPQPKADQDPNDPFQFYKDEDL